MQSPHFTTPSPCKTPPCEINVYQPLSLLRKLRRSSTEPVAELDYKLGLSDPKAQGAVEKVWALGTRVLGAGEVGDRGLKGC